MEKYMLSDIKFTCENGKLGISWSWESDVESLEIRYKRREVTSGTGSPFIEGKILKIPGKGTANVERKIGSEWGLYDFIFITRMTGGNTEEQIVCHDIMIGEKKKFYWKLSHQKDYYAAEFSEINITIPPKVICLVYEVDEAKYSYTIPYEINSGTKLIFPSNDLLQRFSVSVKAPYDRAYCFIKET
jgi:hypothetical protein